MMGKPNCYNCIHRREVPGDAHSRCAHPAVGGLSDNLFAAMVETLQGKAGDARAKLNVTGNPIGIKRGWFLWPVNFDPTWLLSCDGFEPHPTKQK